MSTLAAISVQSSRRKIKELLCLDEDMLIVELPPVVSIVPR